jgi:putative Mn2+ efflux pump MntP
MEFLSIFLIAIGLSFDSFAVAISSGCHLPKIEFKKAMIISFSLAFFQGLFPLIGWLLGNTVKEYIVEVDHWIAFVILLILGIRMIKDSFEKTGKKDFNPLNPKTLIWLSIATSIDALAVGITLSFINIPIIISCVIIGAVTFIAAMTGILIGKMTGEKFGKRMEIVGGIILIFIGTKILLEHLALI